MEWLFDNTVENRKIGPRRYMPVLTAAENRKGVLDVDTVKGCTSGLLAYPVGGCYGECYAYKTAHLYGLDFSVSVSRRLFEFNRMDVYFAVAKHRARWYRVGTAGDPCHDWEATIAVCEYLLPSGKVPVIITKHWVALSDGQLSRLAALGAVVNTSTSGMDTADELQHRLKQVQRVTDAGMRSVCRVVTCDYGASAWAKECNAKQEYLLSRPLVIDNPLRASMSNERVVNGDIRVSRRADSVGGGKCVSLHRDDVYLGKCLTCPDQCGYRAKTNERKNEKGWMFHDGNSATEAISTECCL